MPESDPEARRNWLKRKLEARDKILSHLELRLRTAPQDKHLLFLQEEHSRIRQKLIEELRGLDLQLQKRHQKLGELVEDYLDNWQTSHSPTAPQDRPAQSEEQQQLQHELETWQEMLKKVEARLLRLPGDPRLIRLRSEHQWRIIRLQEALKPPTGISPPTAATDSATASAELEPAPQPPPPVQRELETWKEMYAKTQARLLVRPELEHLKPLLASYQQRITELESRLASGQSKIQDLD